MRVVCCCESMLFKSANLVCDCFKIKFIKSILIIMTCISQEVTDISIALLLLECEAYISLLCSNIRYRPMLPFNL